MGIFCSMAEKCSILIEVCTGNECIIAVSEKITESFPACALIMDSWKILECDGFFMMLSFLRENAFLLCRFLQFFHQNGRGKNFALSSASAGPIVPVREFLIRSRSLFCQSVNSVSWRIMHGLPEVVVGFKTSLWREKPRNSADPECYVPEMHCPLTGLASHRGKLPSGSS